MNYRKDQICGSMMNRMVNLANRFKNKQLAVGRWRLACFCKLFDPNPLKVKMPVFLGK